MLHILKDLINRLFDIKSKEINKQEPTLVVDNTKNKQEMSKDDYFSSIEKHFLPECFDEDISEEDGNQLFNHFRESIEKKVHPWNFEKNLDFNLIESDRIYYLLTYYMTYLDWYDPALLDEFKEFWFGNNYDLWTEGDVKINKQALRILKYNTLGFKLINGSKDEVERKKEFEKITDNDWIGAKSDNLALLFKAWDEYIQKYKPKVN